MWRGAWAEFLWLPPFLRLSTLVGMLCVLTGAVLAGWILVTLLPGMLTNHPTGGGSGAAHVGAIMLSLLLLGFAFTFLPNVYRSHVRSPDTTGFPFHSWQQQARTTARLAALPLGAFVLALVGPGDFFAVISAIVSLVAAANNAFALTWPASWPVDPPSDPAPQATEPT